ncbi:MAG: polysaccharide biosynthesis tyrosine autokinase [Acidobacteriota bacterium]
MGSSSNHNNSELTSQNGYLAREDVASRLPFLDDEVYESGPERDEEIHLRTYIQRVARHKWLVGMITTTLTLATLFYLWQQADVFKAQSRVQIDRENNGALANPEKDPSPFDDRAYFNTQLELLESPSLITRVIKKLDLEHNQDFLSNDFIDPDSWSSKLKFADGYFTAAETNEVGSADGDNDLTTAIIKAVQGGLTIDPVLQPRQNIKDTRLISISFYHPNPKISVLLSNAVADELVVSNLKNKLTANDNENDYLEKNIAELQAEIRRDEERILNYGRNYQLPSQDSSQNTVVERLVGLNKQLLEAENTRKIAEAEYEAVQKDGVASAVAETADKQIPEIDGRLDELRQRRAQLLVEATEKYPEVIEVNKQIEVLEKQASDKRQRATSLYKTNVETRYRQAQYREQATHQAFDRQRAETLGQNEAAINYRIIQQGVETNKKLLDEMSEKQKQNEMLKAKAPNNIRVTDYAMLPTQPIDPKRGPFVGLAFLFSLSLGVGAALLRDYFDDSVHTTDEVEKMLSLPALAVIPRVDRGMLRFRNSPKAIIDDQLHISDQDGIIPSPAGGGPELLLNSDPHSPLAESFRRLRTSLVLSPLVGNLRKLLVTSSVQSEGKTTTAVNIATSLAQTGVKVLIIDADMRSPRLHSIFGLSNTRGLSDIFASGVGGEELLTEVIQQRHSLHILTSGSTTINSAECLGSNRMKTLFTTLEPVFDYIIIDSPPVNNFVDSTILAASADGVIFVVQGNRSSRELVCDSIKLLRTVGANIIGVVLNKVSVPARKYYRAEV